MTIAAGLAPRALPTASATSLRRRPALALVQAGVSSAPKAPFAMAVVVLLVTGLLGLLVLNTVLAKDSFHAHALRLEARALADTEQVLVREVEALRAPSALAARAAELGMVQAGPPAFLRLSDGAVLGSTEPAQVPLLPDGTPAVPLPPAPQASSDSDSDASSDSDSTSDADSDSSEDAG